MKFSAFVLSLLLCCSLSLTHAQDPVKTLRGKIFDSKTRAQLPAASVRLQSGRVGTAANQFGEYLLKLPVSIIKDNLVISAIGYKPEIISLQNLPLLLSIYLEPASVELEAVVVRSVSALDYLKAVLKKIPDNYDTADVQLSAFYREDVRLGTTQLSFSEAVLDIYRPFFTSGQKFNDQFRIIKGRKRPTNFGRDAQLYYWMSGASNGARGSLSEDLVKYRLAKNSPFNPANYRFYDYRFNGVIRDGNQNLVVMDIVPKKKARKGLLILKVYIEEASKAIVKYNMELSPRGIRVVSRKDKGLGYRIMSNVVHVSTDYHKFQYDIQYNRYGNKWYLNRVTRHWEILVNSKRRNWVDSLWQADMDLLITGIDKKNVQPISEGNIGNTTTTFSNLISTGTDEAFWENYNILKPALPDTLLTQGSLIADSIIPKASMPRAANMYDGKKLHPGEDPKEKRSGFSNRINGFNRADSLRGELTPLRTCYDVTFYQLDVDIDVETKSIKGCNLMRFLVIRPFKKMQVDLYHNMQIDSIVFDGTRLTFTREFNAVFINFPMMLGLGQPAAIKIFYQGVPKTPDKAILMDGGVLWDHDSTGNLWAQVVCQGSGASLWWPNKDHQSDKPDSMKIFITVPSAFSEISNGRLISKTVLPGAKTRYEWLVSYPINNYNVTFNIGKYSHFTDTFVSDDTLTIDYYVMPYNLGRAKKMFTQVKPMLNSFEKYFGKYPFGRDGFTLVESLYPMEHQSGVCIGRITAENAGETNPLLWHESAHEWWGNAVTSKDIADMWIHEAFATYAETLLTGDLFGPEAVVETMAAQVAAVIGKEPVTGVYNVNHIHYNIGDMYSKGSLMIHTFRNVLNNDTLFFKLLKNIQHQFRYTTVSAAGLVAFVNKYTGTDYSYLFEQYLSFVSVPVLEIALKEVNNNLVAKYRWRADAKNFRMPVKVTGDNGQYQFIYPVQEWRTITFKNLTAAEFEADEDSFYIELDAR